MKINRLPDLEVLNKWFILDDTNGMLYWKERKAKHTEIGGIVGKVNPKGYLVFHFDGVITRVHRIIYKMYYGIEPEGELDHIDGNKLNNKPENLRLASRYQNNQNIKKQKNSTSGHKNVYWKEANKKWAVTISAFGKKYHFGYYLNIENAAEVAVKQRKILHGEFASG